MGWIIQISKYPYHKNSIRIIVVHIVHES